MSQTRVTFQSAGVATFLLAVSCSESMTRRISLQHFIHNYYYTGNYTHHNSGCILLQNLSNLDRSRFVRQDRSSPVKKNVQIFLVVVGVIILFLSVQSAADHALF